VWYESWAVVCESSARGPRLEGGSLGESVLGGSEGSSVLFVLLFASVLRVSSVEALT